MYIWWLSVVGFKIVFVLTKRRSDFSQLAVCSCLAMLLPFYLEAKEFNLRWLLSAAEDRRGGPVLQKSKIYCQWNKITSLLSRARNNSGMVMYICLTINELDISFFQNIIKFSNVVPCICNSSVWNYSNKMSIYSSLLILMAWCFSTRASVDTVLSTYQSVCNCLLAYCSSACTVCTDTVR